MRDQQTLMCQLHARKQLLGVTVPHPMQPPIREGSGVHTSVVTLQKINKPFSDKNLASRIKVVLILEVIQSPKLSKTRIENSSHHQDVLIY